MKINNAELISQLFDEPLRSLLAKTKPYISRQNAQTILHLRCNQLCTMQTLFQYRQKLTLKLQPLLNFEICLECEETGASNMIAATEKIAEDNSTEDAKFLSIETLSRATNKPLIEVKALLGKAKEVIHPDADGKEMITESAFDTVVLQWARSFKNGDTIGTAPVTSAYTKPPKSSSPRNPTSTNKILNSELTIEDIIRVKSGKNANIPNLTEKGIQQTLTNFFSKVKMDDTTAVDAISAFIENTSEFGQQLRKKLIAGYKRFTKDPDLQEIENRLTEGAKTYLESMAVTAVEE